MQNKLKISNAGAETDRGFPMRFENPIEDRMIGRRDMMVGLWAGAQLGLPEESRAIYALEVMAAGMMDPRPDDVVDKIMHDFSTRGIPIHPRADPRAAQQDPSSRRHAARRDGMRGRYCNDCRRILLVTEQQGTLLSLFLRGRT